MITLINCFYFTVGFILCFDCGFSLTPVNDPVDFTVVKDSAVKKVQKSRDGLPLDVDINFYVLGKPVRLHLKRNPKLRSDHGVYAIKRSGSGIPVIVHQKLIRHEVFGEYQDPINRAIFTLSCPQSYTDQACDAIMEGTFRAGLKEFRMKLMDQQGLHRARRAAGSGLWNKAKTIVLSANATSKVYGIYETESSPATPTDYKDEGPMISGKVAAAFGRSAKIVRDDIMPGGREHNVEILALIDYGIYQRFYKNSKGKTEMERDNEAKLNIQRYFSHVFNGVDMMYKNIDDRNFGISVSVSGMVIANTPDTSPWSTPLVDVVRDGRDELLVSEALNALISWSFSARNVPENDHIMLITDYDLYSLDSGTKDPRTAGYARVASVCSLDSVSIIEDHGGFQSINAAAHELGHSLGARHDGSSNTCNPDDQFIMTAHGGFETEKTKTNPWRFSTCTVDYFKKYISRLRRNCLSDPADIFDETRFTEFLSNYPGQMYTPNEQCQDILGLESYYGWGKELGSFSDICTSMSCAIPGQSRSFRIYKAATGTSCGDKMWCQTGRCVFDERASIRNPKCVFGDTQMRFGTGQSCRQYMLARPLRCYDNFYSTRCCDTCEKLNTGVPGCEFGDKFLNCRQSGCFDPKYKQECCSTCGLAPQPVLRTTGITPPTTTRPVTRRPVTRRPVTRRPVTRPPATWRPITRRTTTTTRRPTPWRPAPTRPRPQRPVRPTRPPVFVTTSNVVTNRPTNSNLIPSGTKGQCLRLNDRFLLVFTCSSLTTLFGKDACDNSLINRYCCEKCPPARAPAQPVCEDKPTCQIAFPRDCYVKATRDNCCLSCKQLERKVPGCEYGDRIRSCERYVGGLGTAVVCSKYKKYCCGLCSALATSPNTAKTVESNQVVSDTGSAIDTPIGRRIIDPSTFLTRDSAGNVMIVGTGRGKGGKGKKSGKDKRDGKGKKAGKDKKSERGPPKRNFPTRVNISRDPGTGSISRATFTLRPNGRRRVRPRDEMGRFRIVFTGK